MVFVRGPKTPNKLTGIRVHLPSFKMGTYTLGQSANAVRSAQAPHFMKSLRLFAAASSSNIVIPLRSAGWEPSIGVV